ncbi:MAG: Hsp20/alpha crystallin family protein [Defluviitaleaceae bacterium]|nr:Hsp20/alpha crystallin family protein [Defluviitaleaceae bacterium]
MLTIKIYKGFVNHGRIGTIKRDAEYLIEAELPGIQKDEIDLGIEGDNNLCIQINRIEESNKDGKNFIRRERRSSSMSRRVSLAGAKLDEISAKLEDGVLRVTVPKEDKVNTLLLKNGCFNGEASVFWLLLICAPKN